MDDVNPERNGFEYLRVLWASRYWIGMAAVAAVAIGVAVALLSTPVYTSSGTIAPKEAQGSSSGGFLSQFGGLGGMVASQLGAGSNGAIDRVEIILKGHELAATVITENDLIPKLFPKLYDAKKGAWKTKSGAPPEIRKAADYLRSKVLMVRATPKKKLISIGARTYDSALSARIAGLYIDALNRKIQRDVLAESDLNQRFLGEQLSRTNDPLLREKLQNLISLEIEKSMLVSSNSFDILERPMVPLERSAPNRKKIVAIALLLGLFGSSILVIVWDRYSHILLRPGAGGGRA